MIIYGDSISGNCLKVKWVADLLGVSYQWRETSVLAKETRTPEFLALNPAGQVPLVVFEGDRPLAQSNAILLHLAEGSALIPSDPYERAKMFEWLFWEQYSHEPVIAVRRFHKHYLNKPDSEIDPALMSKGLAVLGLMEAHLDGRRFFVGETLSLADIALVAYTRLAHEGGFDLAPFPALRGWIGRVEQGLKLQAT